MRFYLWPKAKPGVVNWIWQIMAACSCNPSIQQVWTCLSMYQFFWTIIVLDVWKMPMKWIDSSYFQQAVLLCLLKALYYAGICSYAAGIILCPKLCWHNYYDNYFYQGLVLFGGNSSSVGGAGVSFIWNKLMTAWYSYTQQFARDNTDTI